MKIFGRVVSCSKPGLGRQALVTVMSLALLFATWPQNLSAYQDTQAPAQTTPRLPTAGGPGAIQQLITPIALYPYSLVAQILAASTFPEQVAGRPMGAGSS